MYDRRKRKIDAALQKNSGKCAYDSGKKPKTNKGSPKTGISDNHSIINNAKNG